MQQLIKEIDPLLSGSVQNAQSCSSLSVTTLTEDAGFDAIRDEWDQALDDSDQSTYFLRWAWNHLWWRTYAPPNSRLFLITCRNEYGQLVGVAPFYWRERRIAGVAYLRDLQFLGTGIGVKINEYMDIVARRGYERVVAESIANTLRRNDEWDRLWLWCIPSSSTVLPHFQHAMGENTKTMACDQAHYVDTCGDWESFLHGLGKSTRNNIKYRTRRLYKSHACQLNLVETAGELDSTMNVFVRLHQARWESKGHLGSFKIPRFESFLREAMRVSFVDGRLRLWTLTIDGQIAAALVAFFDQGVAHYFQGGFDPIYAEFRVGVVLLGLCIQSCFEDPEVRAFDFMGGGAKYKDHWTKTCREMCELESFRPGMRSWLYVTCRFAQRTTLSVLRAVLPRPVKAMGRKLIASLRGSTS